MSAPQTQRFYVVLATDGDVQEQELGEVFIALGYRGVLVLDPVKADHEHPCPSDRCIAELRREGHDIPRDTVCCICWGMMAT